MLDNVICNLMNVFILGSIAQLLNALLLDAKPLKLRGCHYKAQCTIKTPLIIIVSYCKPVITKSKLNFATHQFRSHSISRRINFDHTQFRDASISLELSSATHQFRSHSISQRINAPTRFSG